MTEADIIEHLTPSKEVVREFISFGQKQEGRNNHPGGPARAIAEEMSSNFDGFLRCNNAKFSAYFMLENPTHIATLKNLAEIISNKYPVNSIEYNAGSEDTTDLVQVHKIHFSEVGAGLLVTTQSREDGIPFAVFLNAYYDDNRPAEIVGKLATQLSMQ